MEPILDNDAFARTCKAFADTTIRSAKSDTKSLRLHHGEELTSNKKRKYTQEIEDTRIQVAERPTKRLKANECVSSQNGNSLFLVSNSLSSPTARNFV
jgi:hypothetical protein